MKVVKLLKVIRLWSFWKITLESICNWKLSLNVIIDSCIHQYLELDYLIKWIISCKLWQSLDGLLVNFIVSVWHQSWWWGHRVRHGQILHPHCRQGDRHCQEPDWEVEGVETFCVNRSSKILDFLVQFYYRLLNWLVLNDFNILKF